jgi:hypothetical protein
MKFLKILTTGATLATLALTPAAAQATTYHRHAVTGMEAAQVTEAVFAESPWYPKCQKVYSTDSGHWFSVTDTAACPTMQPGDWAILYTPHANWTGYLRVKAEGGWGNLQSGFRPHSVPASIWKALDMNHKGQS